MNAAFAVLALASSALGLGIEKSVDGHISLGSLINQNDEALQFRRECGKKQSASSKLLEGASVLKDGYSQLVCLTDHMYLHGDKNDKPNYDGKSGLSIVRYDDMIAKEDKQKMTPQVCFRFCRTIEGMGFFGIVNGRNCYCTPFFQKVMTDDSSQCDATCEGDATQMCGGKTKSNVYEMHLCQNTRVELTSLMEDANNEKKALSEAIAEVAEIAGHMQSSSAELQPVFGKVGDSTATDLMQRAKLFAGDIAEASKAALSASRGMGEVLDDAAVEQQREELDITAAEDIMAAMKTELKAVHDNYEKMDHLLHLSHAKDYGDSLAQYVSVTKEKTATCDGKVVDKPLVVEGKGACASACDASENNHATSSEQKCMGFQYVEGPTPLCFLFGEIHEARSYTGCKEVGTKFLQVKTGDAPFESSCYAKLSKFVKSSVEHKDVNRCYGMPEGEKTAAQAAAEAAAAEYGAAAEAAKDAMAAAEKAQEIAAAKKAAMEAASISALKKEKKE